LKTVALACAMAQAGLPVPAGPGSMVPIYEDILVDIGDEQSLQQSLSTFSSHLMRVLEMLERADGDTLVLIDELGAGTDPDEGAAIGRAIVDELLARGCPALITTHLGVLKSLAYTEARVENACVDFDVQTLRPTYRLLIGEPGNSNAIEIAARLGLPAKITEAARGHLAGSHQQLTRAIRGTLFSRRQAERARADAERARVDAEKEKEAAERARIELRDREGAFQRWVETVSSLRPGDLVHIGRFDRDGRIVRMLLHKQLAVVEVGAVEMEIPIRELSPPKAG
jgi:DNA mismatch repair protein MutS2